MCGTPTYIAVRSASTTAPLGNVGMCDMRVSVVRCLFAVDLRRSTQRSSQTWRTWVGPRRTFICAIVAGWTWIGRLSHPDAQQPIPCSETACASHDADPSTRTVCSGIGQLGCQTQHPNIVPCAQRLVKVGMTVGHPLGQLGGTDVGIGGTAPRAHSLSDTWSLDDDTSLEFGHLGSQKRQTRPRCRGRQCRLHRIHK